LYNKTNQEIIVDALKRAYIHNRHLKSHSDLVKKNIVSSLSQIAKQSKNGQVQQIICNLVNKELDTKLKKTLFKYINE